MAILEGQAFNKGLTSLRNAGKRTDRLVHQLAVSATVQIRDHRNTTPLNSLLSTMKEGKAVLKYNALVKWAEFYSMVDYRDGKFVLNDNKTVRLEDWEDGDGNHDGGLKVSPFHFKAPKESKPVDVQKVLKTMLRSVTKAREDNPRRVPASLVQRAKELAREAGVEVED